MARLYLHRVPSEEQDDSDIVVRACPVKNRRSDDSFLFLGEELKRLRIPHKEIRNDKEENDDKTRMFYIEFFKSKPKNKDGFRVKKLYLTCDNMGSFWVGLEPVKFDNHAAIGPHVINKEVFLCEEELVFCEYAVEKHLKIKAKSFETYPVWIRWRVGSLPKVK